MNIVGYQVDDGASWPEPNLVLASRDFPGKAFLHGKTPTRHRFLREDEIIGHGVGGPMDRGEPERGAKKWLRSVSVRSSATAAGNLPASFQRGDDPCRRQPGPNGRSGGAGGRMSTEWRSHMSLVRAFQTEREEEHPRVKTAHSYPRPRNSISSSRAVPEGRKNGLQLSCARLAVAFLIRTGRISDHPAGADRRNSSRLMPRRCS